MTSEYSTSLWEPFPPLAVELVRYIMELSAKEDRQTSLALTRVSRAVHKWITPVIYHTVILRHDDQVLSFRRTVKRLNCRVGVSVRHLLIKGVPEHYRAIAEIISCCTQLMSVVTTADMADPDILAMIGFSCPGPRHMSLIYSVWTPPLGHPLLQNITHLYIDFLNNLETVPSLPRLTHFGVGRYGNQGHLEYVPWVIRVLSSPSLVILLLLAFNGWGKPMDVLVGERWNSLAKIDDERLLVGPGLSWRDHVSLVDAGATIWDDAEIKYRGWRRQVQEAHT
jgi:hypothetical protein